MERSLVAIVGPTAAGKTAAALAVARRLPVEVVSADSRQVRAGMRIGTAAPTEAELAAVPHHLVGCVAPDAPWTLADFLREARTALAAIWARGRLPLLVGGTGQYVWALLEGWQPPAVPPDPALRAALEREAAGAGVGALHARLAALDAGAAARVDARNPRRVIRALEVALA
ncbi:MAG: tRNA (adenosine(37)-N6)-dimethylallyltransferase MiaA, partial [Chloroflexi bacterium]|nr:tRNA (adenosine(37)-N6)-dimethylallyltransferase MiaA [Chloroflexota bacterium]